MQESEIKIGRYYLINTSIEGLDHRSFTNTNVGKLLSIIYDSQYKHGGRQQICLIEFTKISPHLHDGSTFDRDVKTMGKNNQCYYVSLKSILKEIPIEKVLAKEL